MVNNQVEFPQTLGRALSIVQSPLPGDGARALARFNVAGSTALEVDLSSLSGFGVEAA
ncbi:MAG: hypothetical protein AB1705_26350 [Verrucomicrobiota bacterium]